MGLSLLLSHLFLSTAWATADASQLNLQDVESRFITTVVEARVDQQLTGAPQVKLCLEQEAYTAADVNATDTDKENKIKRIEQCLKEQLGSLSESQLLNLSNTIGLEAFGVVKGQNASAVVDYFAKRLRKTLTGSDEQKPTLKGLKVVDQKSFIDIYETQLGKSVLLEISQYCSQTLRYKEDPDKTVKKLAEGNIPPSGRVLDDVKLENPSFVDHIPSAQNNNPGATNSGQADIYRTFVDSIFETSGTPDQETIKTKLKSVFNKCVQYIPALCERYEACRPCLSADPPSCSSPQDGFYCGSDDKIKIGQASCHTMAKLRGYRLNLQLTAEVKDHFKNGNEGKSLVPGAFQGNYTRPTGQEIDDVTAITTADVKDIIDQDKINEQVEEITNLKCEENPENPDCEKHFYTEDEAIKLANASIVYRAGTEIEVARVTKALEENKLYEYLEGKGYLDILEKIRDGLLSPQQAVAEAEKRLRAERDATLAQMTDEFEKRQLKGAETSSAVVVNNRKDELGKKSDELKKLVLFNNVVTSYLDISRIKADGTKEDAGKNTESLKREIDNSKEEEGAQLLNRYFSDYAQESEIGDDESPLVDVGFLDALLGNADTREVELNNPSPRD